MTTRLLRSSSFREEIPGSGRTLATVAATLFAVSTLTALNPAAAADPAPMRLRVVAPDDQPLTSPLFRIISKPSEIAGETTTTIVPAKNLGRGIFELGLTGEQVLPSVELEVLTSTTRRARFLLRDLVPRDGADLPRIQLEAGVDRTLTLIDAVSRKPLAGAVVGPVIPANDARPGVLERTYPFFTIADEAGQAHVHGLIAGEPYEAPVYHPGHLRKKVRLEGPLQQTEALVPGGTTMTVSLQGHRTGRPYPNLVLEVTDPSGLSVRARSDSEGLARFPGMARGTHRLLLDAPHLGETAPIVASWNPDPETPDPDEFEKLAVPVPEGVDFSGTAYVQGTTETLRDVLLSLGPGLDARTDAEGRFAFRRVYGPWPRTFRVLSPGYKLLRADQPDSGEVAAFDLKDRHDIVLRLRPERFLEVDATDGRPAEVLSVQPVWLSVGQPAEPGPDGLPVPTASAGQASERRLARNRTELFEVNNSDPVVLLGTRGRGADETQIQVVQLEKSQTTTTVRFTPLSAATLRVQLTAPKESDLPRLGKLHILLPFDDGRLFEVAAASIDAEGLATLTGLPAGEFVMLVPRMGVRQGRPWVRQTVRLAPGESREISLEIRPGGTISGIVVSPDGAPQPEIAVTLQGRDATGAADRQTIMTDFNGKFRSEGWDGPVVSAISTHHSVWKDGLWTDVPVPSDGLRLVLQPRPSLAVQLDLPESDRLLAVAHLLRESQRSDEITGDYRLFSPETSIPFAGQSAVMFQPQPGAPLRAAVNLGRQWLLSLPIEWQADAEPTTVTLTSQPPATLVVKFPTQPQPASEIEWTLTHLAIPDGQFTSAFDPVAESDGVRFESLPAGPYLLIASRNDGASAALNDIELGPGRTEVRTVNFDTSLANLNGVVLDGAGNPVAAKVSIHSGESGDNPPITSAQSDPATGRFALRAIPTGRSYLVVARGAAAQSEIRVDLRAGSPVELLELRLVRRLNVRLKLSDTLTRKTASGSRIVMRGGGNVDHPVAAGEGPFAMASVPAGKYSVLLDDAEVSKIQVEEDNEIFEVPTE